MNNQFKYIISLSLAGSLMTSAYYFPAETFLAFTAGWLFIIPAVFIVYMVHGLAFYMSERKHRIEVTIKPTEAMKALARREMELKREKEKILYEESIKE